jgi:hypothetical protein
VERSDVHPDWLEDGNFWYSVNDAGRKEYVLINTKDGSRTSERV